MKAIGHNPLNKSTAQYLKMYKWDKTIGQNHKPQTLRPITFIGVQVKKIK